MQNVNNQPTFHTSDFYAESFDTFQQSQFFRRLEKKFTPQPYYIKFRPLQRIALFTSFLFNTFSALTASSLVYFFVKDTTGFHGAAIVVTVCALAVLEASKRKTGSLFFKDFLQFRKASAALAALVLLLTALSVSSSYFGAKKLVKQFTPPPALEDAAAAAAPIREQLAEIDRQIEKHLNNKNNRGAVYERSQRAAESLTKQKETLLAQWVNLENRTATKNETTATAHLSKTTLEAEHFAAVTLLLELLFLLCAFYLEYFDFRSFTEFAARPHITENNSVNFAFTKPGSGLQPQRPPTVNTTPATGESPVKLPQMASNGNPPDGHFLNLAAPSEDAVHKAIKHVKGRIASAAHRLRNGIGRPETSRANIEKHTAELRELEALL
jgi:hypothetical protein